MKKNSFLLLFPFFITGIVSAQWTEQTTVVNTQLTSISAPDDNNAWICGSAGKVLRTTNGGAVWTAVTDPSVNSNLNIFAVDANNALVTYTSGGTFVIRTTDAGTTWSQVFTQTEATAFIDAIWMTSPTNGFIYGDPVGNRWSLWKTTNGGANWDSTGLYLPQVSGESGWNKAMFILGSAVWFGTNATHIYYSPTNGLTGSWTSQTTPAANQFAIWFNSPTTGLSGGASLYSTTNAGVSWTSLTAPGTGNVFGITGTGANYWFVRQAAASIYSTTNNGTFWTTEYTAPSGTYNHIGMSRTGTRLWAVRNNGGISKSDGVIGIVAISTETPSRFSLNQNYPNPFNPSTVIRFQVAGSGFVKLSIFDVLGREVATLVNQQLQPGTYEVNFDGANFPSGVYFYKLIAREYNETKKMILVK